MENTMTARANCLVSKYTARANGADRRLIVFHCPHLNARGVGSQCPVGVALNEKSILHVACRVFLWKIQGCKIVPIVLYFGAFANVKSNAFKDVYNLVFNGVDWVYCAKFLWVSRARQVSVLA